jgi:hypothetical protein
MATMNKDSALFQSAKLEVTLKEFILQGQYDVAKAQEILIRQRATIHEMEKELDQVRMAGKEDAKCLKDLENALGILRKALERNQGIVKGFA